MDKLKENLENKDFLKELVQKETIDEAQEMFLDKDINLTKQEVEKIGEVIEATNNKCEALNQEELDKISGGGAFAAVCTVAGAALGSVLSYDCAEKNMTSAGHRAGDSILRGANNLGARMRIISQEEHAANNINRVASNLQNPNVGLTTAGGAIGGAAVGSIVGKSVEKFVKWLGK